MKQAYNGVPMLGFAAHSGTGKTTLLVRLLPLLRQKGLSIAVVKHAHHSFDTDQPGKDSYELRKAGAAQMLVGSSRRSALIVERPIDTGLQAEPVLADLLPLLDCTALDLILVEGFKTDAYPKIELHRAGLERPLLCLDDESIVAVASDEPVPAVTHIPVMDLNQADEISEFIVEFTSVPQRKIRA